MKNGIEIFYVSLNVLYYVGIALLVYLYAIDDNTAMWMIAEGMVVVGILSIAIPDMLINIEVGNISVSIVRSIILNKYLLFCIVHMWLNKYFLLVKVLVGMSALIDLILEVCLIDQMNSACISLNEFIENLNKFDTTVVDKILKYYALYIISILLYLNIHSNLYEIIIMLFINVTVHFVVLNKIVNQIKCNTKWKIRMMLWIVFLITIVCASFNCCMVTYSLIGTYVMIATDLLQAKRTSLVKIDFFE